MEVNGKQLLMTTKAGDLFPERNRIVFVSKCDPLSLAFQVCCYFENNF